MQNFKKVLSPGGLSNGLKPQLFALKASYKADPRMLV
jgi:hypothetical protein